MSKSNSNDQVDPGACLLVLVLIVIIIALAISAIQKAIKTKNFDRAFDAESITFNTNYIALDEEGSPSVSIMPEWVPDGDTVIIEHPRLYKISGCVGLVLPDNAEGVYTSTSFYQPDLVKVSVPSQTSGYVNVCVPQGTQIDVVLWVKVPKE